MLTLNKQMHLYTWKIYLKIYKKEPSFNPKFSLAGKNKDNFAKAVHNLAEVKPQVLSNTASFD